jgi:hypothetical protein
LLQANQYLDSVLVSRNLQLTDYYRFKDGMKERTWINMVNLGDKALQIIESDNLILDNFLQNEMNKSQKLNTKLEAANLEILLLKREVEVNSIILEEQRFLNTNLIIITGVSIILFVILLILFIDRQIRYRSTNMELERLWARSDDQPIQIKEDKLNDLQQKEFESLTEQNKVIKRKLEEMSELKIGNENALQKEIDSRMEVEKEIKSLISQIKKLS